MYASASSSAAPLTRPAAAAGCAAAGRMADPASPNSSRCRPSESRLVQERSDDGRSSPLPPPFIVSGGRLWWCWCCCWASTCGRDRRRCCDCHADTETAAAEGDGARKASATWSGDRSTAAIVASRAGARCRRRRRPLLDVEARSCCSCCTTFASCSMPMRWPPACPGVVACDRKLGDGNDRFRPSRVPIDPPTIESTLLGRGCVCVQRVRMPLAALPHGLRIASGLGEPGMTVSDPVMAPSLALCPLGALQTHTLDQPAKHTLHTGPQR